MTEAYIIDAVRTPVGRRRGGLAQVHPADLGAHVLQALINRTKIPDEAVDDVVFGCVDAVGPQAGDIARTCWLAAGFHESVPGVTVDRQCGSSQQALHFAAQGVMSGTQDLVIAGGQNMSMVPIMPMIAGEWGTPTPLAALRADRRYGGQPVNQFYGAEMIAKRWGCVVTWMPALQSHQRAITAQDEGRFDNELSPPRGDTGRGTALRPVLRRWRVSTS